MNSLKQTLLDYLKSNGRMTFQQMEGICKLNSKKVSNGEKRLRDLRAPILNHEVNPDYDPNIGVIYNDKKTAIVAYTYYTGPKYPPVEKFKELIENWWDEPKYKKEKVKHRGLF
jgi:hypothetical protein